ncbi:MAG: DUF1003 domain-containing protein [Candidatus Sericytochromatia bacterium]
MPESLCSRCGKSVAADALYPVPAHLLQLSGQAASAELKNQLCQSCLHQTRRELISQMLGKDHADLNALEAQVVQRMLTHETVSAAPEEEDEVTTWPDRLSDNIARFGGSWRFICSFGAVLVIWIGVNSLALFWRPFDPFPFILLNLVLSCLAALQAPVIMMSQNRQEQRDRRRSINDYQVNLKAELEIRQLHLKLDQLLYHQWQQLTAIQEMQLEMLEELIENTSPRKRAGSPDTNGSEGA